MTPNCQTVRSKLAGVSLFEILVALSLMALISAGLASALQLSITALNRAKSSVSQSDPSILRGHMRTWLRQSERSGFVGRPEGFEFRIAGTYLGRPAVELATVSINSTSVRTRITISEGIGIQAEQTKYILTESPTVFAYFDATRQSWVSQWNDPNRLPRLVRIIAARSDPNWPPYSTRTTD